LRSAAADSFAFSRTPVLLLLPFSSGIHAAPKADHLPSG
jgi:hypothetical protein